MLLRRFLIFATGNNRYSGNYHGRSNHNNNNGYNNQGNGRDRKRSRKDNDRHVPTGPVVPLMAMGGGMGGMNRNSKQPAPLMSSDAASSGFRSFAQPVPSERKQSKNVKKKGGLASYANVNAMDDDDVNYERR